MSWDEIMRRVLPPMRDQNANVTVSPHTTSPFGSTNRPVGSTNPHRAVDFNYVGGQISRFNKSHPALRAPVTGIITKAGDDRYGTIAIRDENGLSHEILHTNSRHVSVGDPVIAGQLIGTMGNTGTSDQHVHYQLKDRNGGVLDPSAYWDQQGVIDPSPAPPAFLKGYLEYQRSLGSSVDNAFSKVPDAGPRYGSQLAQLNLASPGWSSASARNDIRVLRSRPANEPAGSSPVGTVSNELPPPDSTPSFSDRFGNWGASSGGSAPLSPYQQFSPPPPSAKPLGVITGQPMPDYPFPPPIFGGPTPGLEDWAALRRKPANWDREG